jgi:hypothetical protein
VVLSLIFRFQVSFLFSSGRFVTIRTYSLTSVHNFSYAPTGLAVRNAATICTPSCSIIDGDKVIAIENQNLVANVALPSWFRLSFDVAGTGVSSAPLSIFHMESPTGTTMSLSTTDTLALDLTYNDVLLTGPLNSPLLVASTVSDWTTVVVEYTGDEVAIYTSENVNYVIRLQSGVMGYLETPGAFALYASNVNDPSSGGYLRHLQFTGAHIESFAMPFCVLIVFTCTLCVFFCFLLQKYLPHPHSPPWRRLLLPPRPRCSALTTAAS